ARWAQGSIRYASGPRLVDAKIALAAKRSNHASHVINDIDAPDRRFHCLGIFNSSHYQLNAQLSQRIDLRLRTNQAAHAIAAANKRLDQMQTDEARGAGNEDRRHAVCVE